MNCKHQTLPSKILCTVTDFIHVLAFKLVHLFIETVWLILWCIIYAWYVVNMLICVYYICGLFESWTCNILLLQQIQGRWEPLPFCIYIHKYLNVFSILRMFVEYLTKNIFQLCVISKVYIHDQDKNMHDLDIWYTQCLCWYFSIIEMTLNMCFQKRKYICYWFLFC